MRTVQMTLDERLVTAVDRVARRLKMSRSAFTREALRAAIRAESIRQLELKHQAGYQRKPVTKDELGGWDEEQVWPA